jgi:hypothetical protein
MVGTLRVFLASSFLATAIFSFWPVADLQDLFTPADSSSSIGDLNDDGGDQSSHHIQFSAWVPAVECTYSAPVIGWITERDTPKSGCVLTIIASPRSPPRFS